jgi:hypothetical protein
MAVSQAAGDEELVADIVRKVSKTGIGFRVGLRTRDERKRATGHRTIKIFEPVLIGEEESADSPGQWTFAVLCQDEFLREHLVGDEELDIENRQ